MKNNIKYCILLLIFVLIICLTFINTKIYTAQYKSTETKLLALNSKSYTEIISNTTQVNSGEEIKITFKLKVNENLKQYINTYKARIEYDENIFELIDENNFVTNESWSNLQFNPTTKEFIVINLNNVSDDITTLTLKVRSDVKDTEKTYIQLSSAETADWNNNEIINLLNDSKEQVELTINNTTPNENNTYNEISENNEESKNVSTEKANIKDGIIPNLGKNSPIVPIIIFITTILIILYLKVRKNHKKNTLFAIIGTFIVGTFLMFNIANASTINGDLNQDGTIDIQDIQLLEKHLIYIDKLENENLADISNDGKIDILDLSLLINLQKSTENLDNQDSSDKNSTDKIESDESNNTYPEENAPVDDGENKEENNPTETFPSENPNEDEKQPDNIETTEPEKPSTEHNTKTAQEAVNEMKVGWNLGNTLDSCNYTKNNLGESSAITYYETLWGNPITTKAMIDEVKKAGFTSIRVPVTYYDHIHEDGTIDELWFQRVETVVNYVLENDMYCILDIHHDTGLCEIGSWIRTDANAYEENAKKLSKLWTQIANRFKDYDYKLVFEGFNEIVDTNKNYDWITGYDNTINVNKLNQVFVDTIRATGGKNADRFLAVTTFGGITDEQKLSTFTMPNDTTENKIILALHDYCNDETSINNMYSRIKKYCTDKQIPVILDEFGTQSNSLTEEQRAQSASKYVSCAKQLGITCFWWDDGGNYILFNRRSMSWEYEKIKNAIINSIN